METASKDLDYLAILRGIVRRHKLLMVGMFLGLAIPLLAWLYKTHETSYVSTATIAVESSVLDRTPLFRDIAMRENAVPTYLILLRSRSFSEAVVEALPRESFEELVAHSEFTGYLTTARNLVKRWLGYSPASLSPQQRAIEELRDARMDFLTSRESPAVITITGSASTQRTAMDLVNTHIQVLLSRTRSRDQEESRKAAEFLEQQVKQVKEGLTQAEEALTKFQQQKGRLGLGSQTDLDLMKLSQTENAIADAEASRTVLAARIESLRQSLEQPRYRESRPSEPQNAEKKEAAPPSPSAEMTLRFDAFKAAQEQLTKLEARLATLRERYTDANPLVQAAQEEVLLAQAKVARLARELPVAPIGPTQSREGRSATTVPIPPVDRTYAFQQLTALEMEESALKAKIATLKGQADRLRLDLRSMTRDDVQFSTLRRTVDTTRNLYTVLSDRLMAARIREQGDSGLVRIIDPASFPLQPSRSRTQRLVLMVLGVAAALAFGAAFGLEFLRLPVETESDVQKATALRVLGSVGTIGAPKHGRNAPPKYRSRGTPIYLPTSPVNVGIHIELYRAMRAPIEMDRLKHHFHSILFTSAAPSEGKTSTVLNLSHVFQEFGRRILIIDADLRRPAVHTALAVNNRPGLIDYLKGRAAFEDVCRSLPSGVVVVPGQVSREDASSLLASPRFGELLDQAKGLFDLVFVDSAPILAVPDNLLLANSADRVVLVVKASATSQRDLRKAHKALQRSEARILGVILNQANPRDVDYYHPRYRKYYTSRGNNGKDAVYQEEAGRRQRAAGSSNTAGSRQIAAGSKQ